MSTRGTAVIGGQRYFIATDACPSYAKSKLEYAVKNANTVSGVVRLANKKAYSGWLTKMSKGERFGYPFEEYRWIVNMRNKTVKQDIQRKRRHDRMHKNFMKRLKEGKIKY